MNKLDDLPLEILFYILSLLDFKDICVLASVNKHFYQVSMEVNFWNLPCCTNQISMIGCLNSRINFLKSEKIPLKSINILINKESIKLVENLIDFSLSENLESFDVSAAGNRGLSCDNPRLRFPKELILRNLRIPGRLNFTEKLCVFDFEAGWVYYPSDDFVLDFSDCRNLARFRFDGGMLMNWGKVIWPQFNVLVSIEIKKAEFLDFDLGAVVGLSKFLKILILEDCRGLINVKLESKSLKSLTIIKCYSIVSLNILVNNLEDFTFADEFTQEKIPAIKGLWRNWPIKICKLVLMAREENGLDTRVLGNVKTMLMNSDLIFNEIYIIDSGTPNPPMPQISVSLLEAELPLVEYRNYIDTLTLQGLQCCDGPLVKAAFYLCVPKQLIFDIHLRRKYPNSILHQLAQLKEAGLIEYNLEELDSDLLLEQSSFVIKLNLSIL